MAQGNIRERSPGSFEVRVYAGSRGGKRFYITRTVRGTRKDAEAVLTRIQHEYNSGLVSAPSRGTVAEFLAEWLESADLAASTLVTTRGIVNRHLVPLLGDIRLTTLRVSDIDKAWAKLRRQGYKGSTIRRVHGVLHRALGVAVRWDRIASNPAVRADVGSTPKRAVTTLSDDERAALLKVLDPVTARFVRIMAGTGMRPQEVAGLQAGDIDVEGGRITIKRRVMRGKGSPTVVDLTKGGKGRVVAVGDATARVLAEQLAYQEQLVQRFGRFTQKTFLFSDAPDVNRPWCPSLPSKRWARACKLAGVEARLYDLRHTHASTLLNAGIDVATVAARIGHARASTTLNHYSGVLPGSDERAALEADRLLG